jgi:hypothetical protein
MLQSVGGNRSVVVRDKILNPPTEPMRRDQSQIDAALESIREALVGLQFGEVLVVLQDGVVVQLERTERKRFRKSER